MKKQKIKFPILLLITALLYPIGLDAQPTTIKYRAVRNPQYMDMTVQSGRDYLYLEAFGADGGQSTYRPHSGGRGAKVSGYLTIGDGPNQVPVGSVIRFIPGQVGKSRENYGDGGGGTAVACKMGTSWHLLMVAGGGGGAGDREHGREGNFWEDGSGGLCDAEGFGSGNAVSDNGGTDGNGGGSEVGSGGGGYKVSMPNGIPLGFLWDQGGSFGFGSGYSDG